MPRFLYYIPGIPGADREMIKVKGLLSRFTLVGGNLKPWSVTRVDEGREGWGCIITAGEGVPQYDYARQQWLQGPDYWVGIEDQPPGPADLVRDVIVAGEEIVLGDGCEWVVPTIQKWDGTTNLPKVLTPVIGPDGSRRTELRLKPEYAEINALATRIFGYFLEGKSISLDEAMDAACRVLAVNYRVGQEEAGLLGLLNGESVVEVLKCCIDYQGWVEAASAADVEGLAAGQPREVP